MYMEPLRTRTVHRSFCRKQGMHKFSERRFHELVLIRDLFSEHCVHAHQGNTTPPSELVSPIFSIQP